MFTLLCLVVKVFCSGTHCLHVDILKEVQQQRLECHLMAFYMQQKLPFVVIVAGFSVDSCLCYVCQFAAVFFM